MRADVATSMWPVGGCVAEAHPDECQLACRGDYPPLLSPSHRHTAGRFIPGGRSASVAGIRESTGPFE